MAAADVTFDVLQQILLGLDDVKDIIRCKSVCKSWHSFISTPRFVKAHLNHHRDNFGDRRIGVMHMVANDENSFCCNFMYIVGSCNGLVCVSPRDVQLEVTNPWTREIKTLQAPPCQPDERLYMIRLAVECLGFGYDASTDDYKVIAGFTKEEQTLFYVLTLKSNIWKVIREVKYTNFFTRSGFLCGGALHWIMTGKEEEKVIVSLDLSTEEFKEIPQPADADNLYGHRLGVIKDCLCIYSDFSPLASKKWVMKNNKWELYNNNNESKYDVAHCLSRRPVLDSQNRTSYFYTCDDGRLVPSAGDHIRASMFVKSLVSPHPYKGQLEGNVAIRNRKRKRSSKHKRGLRSRVRVTTLVKFI